MKIEIGDDGLRFRYHWRTLDIPGTDDPATAAYLAVRQLCPFLTDDNHTWEAKDYGPSTQEQQESPAHRRLSALIDGSRYHIVIRRLEEWGPYRTKFWFHFAYRVPKSGKEA